MARRGATERGAALVEGVIVAPALLLLLFLVMRVDATRGALLRATAQVRACALEYAQGGCDQAPAGCEGVLSRARGAPDDRVVRAAQRDTHRELSGLGRIRSEMGSISTFPVLGDAIQGLFGSRARATVSGDVREGPARRLSAKVTGRFVVACSGKPSRAQGVADELFDAIF